MLKKRIKAICLACVLVCTLPIASYAIDKEDFMKFLIDSSYPESKTDENEDSSSNTNKENVSQENGDYIKVHIGEENVPVINNDNNTEVTESGSDIVDKTVSSITTGYTNNIKVTGNNPRILLYHTHSCETYADSPDGNYHSQDMPNSVMAVGQSLTQELNKKGMDVVHSIEYHDYPSYNGSYSRSLKTLNELLPQYSSIDITIDLHREGLKIDSEEAKERLKEKYTANLNGEEVAKFFFVVGEKNPNAAEVNQLAQDLTKIAEEKYPELILPVIKKDNGKFNQYVAKNGILVEIGSNTTSTEAAKAATKYVADVLDTYFSQNK
ncbi:MAG: stage II sporulation protein P [Peptostreptococcaceae bacterium]